ncbi:MAG: hypothetical protein P8M73_11470 [Luminiphilus sp.]|jgi:hypothetical protein|nr:hypothetical protein [Luminiphilus sp.]
MALATEREELGMSDGTEGSTNLGDGIFAAMHELTLKGLEQSLLDAEARYVRGEAAADPSPSMNWAVTNQAVAEGGETTPSMDNLLQEEVILWLSVGKEKLEIVPGSDHAVIPASALVGALQEMKAMVESFSGDRGSELATQFHEIAVDQARPKSPPEEGDKSDWQYDAGLDRYVAV